MKSKLSKIIEFKCQINAIVNRLVDDDVTRSSANCLRSKSNDRIKNNSNINDCVSVVAQSDIDIRSGKETQLM